MKKLFLIIFIVVLGLILFTFFYKTHKSNSVTTSPGANTLNSTGIFSASSDPSNVRPSFVTQINNADKITLGTTKVSYPYALQEWSDSNKGGNALLKFIQDKGWILITMGGGSWDIESLIAEGVPKDIAMVLLSSN